MIRAFPLRHQLSRSFKHRYFLSYAPRNCFLFHRYSTPSSVLASNLQFGQPLHETHPHLLKSGELTPGINAVEYSQRRTRLASLLPRNGIAVLAAAELKYRSGAVFYEFHQDSNFFYLTGFNEPEAVAVIGRGVTDGDHEFHLFVREKDPKAEQWEGTRSGTQAALDVFNADDSGDIESISRLLPPIISGASEIYTDILTSGPTSVFSRFFAQSPKTSSSNTSHTFTSLLSKASKPTKPLKHLLNDLRSIKSPAEISLLRHVGRMSGRAYTSAMRHRWTSERALANEIEHNFRLNGCDTSAYIPVVAAGRNANTIHYVANNALIHPNDTVLVDAGGEYGGYIADITRTWPAGSPDGNKFPPAHRELYSALLAVQRSCISLCRADSHTSLDNLHSHAESLLRDSLSQLGFPVYKKEAMETLFPHHVGHYIGLDVHDTPGQSRSMALREGQCVTVEPGIYVPLDGDEWPERFRGVGMRVEDSVGVGAEGPVVLTVEAVKEIEDIEALRA